MINNQMADSISRSGSFGLAESLENQLVRQVLPKAADQSRPVPAVPPAVKSSDH
jgi:Rod binding domain-containing protein